MNLPKIGKPAPDFKALAVLDDKVYDISLSDFNDKYVILLFFPMDFAFVCPTELVAFSDHLDDFNKINTHIIACSAESPQTHLQWLSMSHADGGIRGLKIPLIADKSLAVARKYGVINEDGGFAYRSTFIIDNKGILRQISVNDRPVGRSTYETFRLVKTIQHAEKVREMTPNGGFPEVLPSSISKPRSFRYLENDLLYRLAE